MSAHAQHLEFAPPPPPGTGRSLTLALFVHALLLVALTAGIQWNQDMPLSAEAELWSAVPQAAAPKLVEVEPPPPPPPPAPKEVVKPPPPAPDREADIALTKKRKQLDDEKKLQQAKDAERRQAELKKAEQKKADEKKAKLKAEEDKRQLDAKREEERKDKERKEKEAKKLQAQKEAKQAAEEAKKLEAIRNDNMKRMAGLAGATGGESATGSALRAAGPSDSYGARIQTLLYPKITFTGDSTPYIVDVEVKCAPNGMIIGTPRVTKPSANSAWDDAVIKAFLKLETLPRDKDGSVPCPLVIGVRQQAKN